VGSRRLGSRGQTGTLQLPILSWSETFEVVPDPINSLNALDIFTSNHLNPHGIIQVSVIGNSLYGNIGYEGQSCFTTCPMISRRIIISRNWKESNYHKIVFFLPVVPLVSAGVSMVTTPTSVLFPWSPDGWTTSSSRVILFVDAAGASVIGVRESHSLFIFLSLTQLVTFHAFI
jgi:hypothetical protein